MSIQKIPLNITAAEGTVRSKKINAVANQLYLNIQFFYNLSGGLVPAKVKILQSIDGGNFDYLSDLSGIDIFMDLETEFTTATLNLIDFLTTYIILEFHFPPGVTGSVSHILFIAR